MDISIIIVNYNVKEFIVPCVHSIYEYLKGNYSFEIIIVDNNSKDGSKESIKYEFPEIRLIENKQNSGFSKAVNQGAKVSIGNYLFILNPDTLLIEDSLEVLLKEINKKNDFGAIGPALISRNGFIQNSVWRFPSLTSACLSIFHLDPLNYFKNYKDKSFSKLSKVDSISGAAILISKKVFSIIEGFNEKLFWMDDVDLCFRLNKLGYCTYFTPETKIIHFSGKSSEKNYKVATSNQLISKIKYFKTHHSNFSYIIIKISVFIVSLIKITISFLLIKSSKKYRQKLYGYFDIDIREIAKPNIIHIGKK